MDIQATEREGKPGLCLSPCYKFLMKQIPVTSMDIPEGTSPTRPEPGNRVGGFSESDKGNQKIRKAKLIIYEQLSGARIS